MPRKRTEQVPVYDTPANPVVPQIQETPPSLFQKGGTAYKGDPRGRLGLYTALHVPPGISICFRLAPGGTAGSLDFQEAKREGWVPANKEQTTSDYDEAVRDGKICLPVFEEGADGYVRVGQHVLMWNYKQEVEAAYIESVQRAAATLSPKGVTVFEDREEEVEAALTYEDTN